MLIKYDLITFCVLFFILWFPGMVDLEASMKFLATRLQQFQITGRINCITQLGILPLWQVMLWLRARDCRLLWRFYWLYFTIAQLRCQSHGQFMVALLLLLRLLYSSLLFLLLAILCLQLVLVLLSILVEFLLFFFLNLTSTRDLSFPINERTTVTNGPLKIILLPTKKD